MTSKLTLSSIRYLDLNGRIFGDDIPRDARIRFNFPDHEYVEIEFDAAAGHLVARGTAGVVPPDAKMEIRLVPSGPFPAPRRELICKNHAEVVKLVRDWHEAGRERFERETPGLDYDSYAPKKIEQKRKYLLLDEGRSGAFVLCRETGQIWKIKSAYGRPDKRKPVGYLGRVTGENLAAARWW